MRPIARSGMTRVDLTVWTIMVALCAALIVWSWFRFAPGPRASAGSESLAPPPLIKAPRITLTDQREEAFDSNELLGRAWIVDFIFTNCPGPCPIMTSNMRTLQESIGPTDRLHLVSITCDPWRDTPQALAAYAQAYGADERQWSFLTGEYGEIQRYARALLLSVENPQQEAERLAREGAAPADDPGDHGGPIVHSSRFVLVGPDGFVRGWYSGTDAAEMDRLLADARLAMESGETPIAAAHPQSMGLVSYLPALNATLNAVSATLLVVGLRLIRRGKRAAHRRTMIAALLVSVAFLASYITYHTLRQMAEGVGHTPWRVAGVWRGIYYTILISHVVLAATVPPLAIRTLWLASKARFDAHRRLARITWPIWMYVAVTGVLVYLMLYQLHPVLLKNRQAGEAAPQARVEAAPQARVEAAARRAA